MFLTCICILLHFSVSSLCHFSAKSYFRQYRYGSWILLKNVTAICACQLHSTFLIFFQAISVFFTARLEMPCFFSPPSPTSFPLVRLKGADKWTDSWIPRYSEGQKKRWSGEMKEWQRVTALGWATEKVEERKEKEEKSGYSREAQFESSWHI